MALPSLRLKEYADNELLAIIRDVADDDGWASNADIAEKIGVEARYANQCVGSRLGWMRRWNLVEREEGGKGWAVTAVGEELIGGRLNKSTERLLDRLKPADRVMMTRALAQAARSSNGIEQVLRREWRREAYLNGK